MIIDKQQLRLNQIITFIKDLFPLLRFVWIISSCWLTRARSIFDKESDQIDQLTVIGQTGQHVFGSGGKGSLQATEQTVSLQFTLPPTSHVQVVQAFRSQFPPSCIGSFSSLMQLARQRHIWKWRKTNNSTSVYFFSLFSIIWCFVRYI